MAAMRPRPLSPHLTVWKWGPAMLVSILHRITGGALSVVGLALLTWWLMALSGDAEGYGTFQAFISWLSGGSFAKAESAFQYVVNVIGLMVGVGLTWAFFQHLLSGIRHLAMDTGQAFELGVNKTSAVLTIIGSILLTAAVWAYLLGAF
jgi:succinate dehydrogenase / fumarate reductase cytochrome b subunit